MKKFIFTLLVLFIATNSFAQDVCESLLLNHLQIVEKSESMIEKLKQKQENITGFDITQLQKNLTDRFGNLKYLMGQFNYKELDCSPKILAEAIAVYDLSKMGKSIFADKELRRIVLGFSKYPLYHLTDLVAYYKEYTSGETIQRIQVEIVNSDIELPEGVILNPNRLDYDPNLYKLSDAAIKGTTSVVAGFARIWGFVSDRLKWRQGRLKENYETINAVKEKLKPLDLLFEKRTYTLANYTIPGHWGHVAVWLGTQEDLIALGVWDKEYFKPFRQFVEQGFNIVEIRKEGLNFQSIESFLNLDEFAITRIEGIEERALNVFEELSYQIDKKYDFKFDSHTADKITCAELIAFSYGDIQWPETKTLFQYSLRPDDLAVLTLDETSPAKFVTYIKGTKEKEAVELGFDEWKKLFKDGVHLTPDQQEELAKQKQADRERLEEERRYNEMYRG